MLSSFPKKELEEEVSNLADELVLTSSVYFERTRGQITFLYPLLDLSKLDFLKVICNGQLVDDETVSPWGQKVPLLPQRLGVVT